jgi:hypothetical protein
MVQLLKLDGIEAEGEARAQRKAEVQFLTLMTAIFFSHVQSECLGLELFFMNEYSQDIFSQETSFCRNAGKGYVHKTQSGRNLPRTLRKQELRTPGYPFTQDFFCLCTRHDVRLFNIFHQKWKPPVIQPY